MRKNSHFYDTIDQVVSYGVTKGILHLHNEDDFLKGNTILLKGKQVVNFGSCSYLGLEFDPRLKEGAKNAIDKYGTQFSESRAYVSLKLYEELENLFHQIFEQSCIVTPTTSLGHIANLPVLVSDSDAVIMDHQVHNSVQTAVNLLKARGIHAELLRHNRMDLLENRIKLLRGKHKKIWYMADGIYSMFGDACPLNDIYSLLNLYPELHFYVDDAHGMSIYGKHGRGFVLDKKEMHSKMIVATSLAKAFATGGAVMVYPNYELARKVRTCGGPLITSGPLQPATLGAAIAAAKIHLSEEIYKMQQELQDKIKYTTLLLKRYGLPLVSEPNASVFFVGTSLPKLGYKMVKRMLDAGYYLNLGIFPAVPIKNTGIRFTITRLHSFVQIEEMIAAMDREFPKALKEEEMTLGQIYKAFKLPLPEEAALDKAVDSVIKQSLSLKLYHHQHIEQVNKEEWNILFEGKGTFDWEGIKTLEESFKGNLQPENNWEFDYILIRDNQNKIVAATFLTTALWKDDMLAPAGVSKQIEEVRASNDPYYLTSKVISTGSLLTEGEHFYIDKTSVLWKEAVTLLFEKVSELQEHHKANSVIIRDFHYKDEAFDNFMVDNGFYRISMPDTNILNTLSHWNTKEEFYLNLSSRSRQHYREDVRRHEDKFIVEVISDGASEEEIEYWYQLYLNVKNHSLELNTFALPKKLFFELFNNKNWEVLILKLKPKYYDEINRNKPVCIVLNYKSKEAYIPMIIGLNYNFNEQHKVYRQALFQIVLRAKCLKAQKVLLGFSASIEKKKVGATSISTYAYLQNKDNFNAAVVSEINAAISSASGKDAD
jgi:7-keto-8-aminopelargonate synthetase-like enzyme